MGIGTNCLTMLNSSTVKPDLTQLAHLGVPVSPCRLHVVDWLPLEEKSVKKLDIWQGSYHSILMVGLH